MCNPETHVGFRLTLITNGVDVHSPKVKDILIHCLSFIARADVGITSIQESAKRMAENEPPTSIEVRAELFKCNSVLTHVRRETGCS